MNAYKFIVLAVLMLLAAATVFLTGTASATLSGALGEKNLPATILSIPWSEQLLVIISGLVIKPAYMVLSFVLILFLRRNPARDLVLIKWSLITFLAGEGFCAAN